MKQIGVLSFFTTAALVAACSSDAKQRAWSSDDVPSVTRKPFSGTVTAGAQVIGGTVHGLSGSGLTLTSGDETIKVSANGAFAFKQKAAVGARYDVAVAGQPRTPWQTCQLFNAEGVVTKDASPNVIVECSTDRHVVGGKVFGLAGSGLALKINDRETIMPTASGDFSFPTSLASGSLFSVEVTAQPQSKNQVCSVAGSTGMVGGSDVSTIVVNCKTNGHAIGGSVTGLLGSLVLSNAGGETTITSNGTYALPPVDEGAPFAVTVQSQPSAPSQTCVVANAVGSVNDAPRTDLDIVCTTDKFTVGGSIAGLDGSGLVLQNNGGSDLTVPQSAMSFAFGPRVESGEAYAVSVLTNPTNPWQTCSVTASGGVVTNADVTAPSVSCTTNNYALKVQVTGLVAQPIKITNGAELLTFAADGTQSFTASVPSGSTYNVTIDTAPSDIPCLVAGGSTNMAGADATVNVVCGHIFSNAPVAAFSAYSQCYSDLYSHTGATLATDIAAACTKSKIVMACRQVGSSTLTTVALGARSDVFFEVGRGNVTHDVDGVSWYFTTQSNSSIGFAPAGAGVTRSSADTAGTPADSALRLSWHSGQGSGGYRCGGTTGLNSSTAWERLVYQAD